MQLILHKSDASNGSDRPQSQIIQQLFNPDSPNVARTSMYSEARRGEPPAVPMKPVWLVRLLVTPHLNDCCLNCCLIMASYLDVVRELWLKALDLSGELC